MSTIVACPALFIAAASSGSGKTTITAALARLFKQKGLNVKMFKTGPDYLDGQILAQASGQSVEQLDLWMAGEDYCRQALFLAAQKADLILIEGAMGLFDGTPSSADLAIKFNIPVALVMNVKGMAQTAAALVQGLAQFNPELKLAGLIANNCSSDRHQELIQQALSDDIPWLARFATDTNFTLPERHLGLVQAEEVKTELESRFNAGAEHLQGSLLSQLPTPVEFSSVQLTSAPAVLQGKRIGIAKDEAFSFIYAENLRLLTDLGASYQFFSPLNDKVLPTDLDALWLPGGYPELHAEQLSQNKAMQQAIKAMQQQAKPILAECGGFLYSLERLSDLSGNSYDMLGLIGGQAHMVGKRGCQGMQTAPLPEGSVRGHSHHRSRAAGYPEPIAYGQRQRHSANGEAIIRVGSVTGSYLHLFFASNPQAIAALFGAEAV